MGFDNESILNIQSLPGEYFCPVCRQLVYPNEAMQTQCTHLYCKPCLTYVLSTTRACPYDGYLVTDTDSKGLQEANPSLAETIGRVAVHCLYHKSGCTWQGPLSDSTAHGNGCPYGSSPVVCNRCGTQIVHRQVQDHAQNCPGTQAQVQQQETAQQVQGAAVAATPVAAVPYEQNQVVQAGVQQYSGQAGLQVQQAPISQPTPYGIGHDQVQVNPTMPQQVAAQTSAPDQWYQQQYQQYYQQYAQYDQYQHYQQYDQYQAQAQAQAQAQPQPQPQPQPQHQPQPQPQSVEASMLAQAVPTPQPYQQMERPAQPGPQPQHLQPQQQIMASQPQQLMPNQSQHVTMQQHPVPMQSQQQSVGQPQQHSFQMHHQFPSPQQPPQMHQQAPSPQQPPQMQQLALLPQQLPHQQPTVQQQTLPHQHQQLLHQPPPQQQPILQQQVPPPQHSLLPQLQQPAQGPMQHHQQFPPQQQQLSHQPLQQPQQQPPFFPQPMQTQQIMQSQVQPGQQQPPQLQPTYQQNLQPPQSFPQHYAQNVGQMNAPQQPGGRPPLTQSHAMLQQPFPQAQGRPFLSPYSQSVRGPNKALQAAPNQLAAPNQGTGPNQTYLPRPSHRAHLSHQQQRPPVQQSMVPRSSGQPALGPGSTATQSVRTAAQSLAAGASKLAPVPEKPTDTVSEKTSNTPLLQAKHAQEPGKTAQVNETADISGQTNIAETVKVDKKQGPPEIKSLPGEQQQANEIGELKNRTATEPAKSEIKSEVSDSSQHQVSIKDSQIQKQEGNSQQLTTLKKSLEDVSEKPSQVIPDSCSLEQAGQMKDASSEHARHRQDGNSQQHPRQVQEGNFIQNISQSAHETHRGQDEKVQQAAHHSQDTLQWQDGSALQQSSQGQERNLQQAIRQGAVQGQDKNLQQPLRQGPVQGQDRNLLQPSRQGSIHGQDRNLLQTPRQGPVHGQDRNLPQPPRQGPVQGQNRNLQQPLRQGIVQGHDRNLQQPHHQGIMEGQDRSLQQPLPQERALQQVPFQPHAQGQERRFQQPSRQGQLQGQQLPYPLQPQGHDRNFQQLPPQGQQQNIPDHFQLSASKQSGIAQAPLLPQHQPGPSSSMPSLTRGHGQIQPQPKNFDLLSASHLQAHNSAQIQAQHMGPRSSQGEPMLGLQPGFPSSVPHHLNSFEAPRSFLERGLQFGQTNTPQQPPLSKPVDHQDILANKKPDIVDNKQNELQQLGASRFPTGQALSFQANMMKTNGGSNKGHIEGMQIPTFPPIMMEESFKSMPQDPSRQGPDRKDFQENPRKYKPGQFEGQSNSDDLFPMRHQKGHPSPTSKFDQIPPNAMPLEMGPHGFLPESLSKYPFTAAGSPTGGSSRLLPPYQPVGSFPSSSGGPSMFSTDIGDGSRLPGLREEMMGRRPESAGMRPDYLGSRSEFPRARLDSLAPPRSPGKDFMGLSSGRVNVGPSVGFGSGIVGPSHLSHPIEELNREPLGFDEQRNRAFGFHSSAIHNVFQPGQHPLAIGNRLPPFPSSGSGPGGQGQFPNHIMIGEAGASFGSNIPMQGFTGESGFLKGGPMSNDIEPLDHGRKRKPGSTGWCRICQIDCYTVEGLDQHSQTREHQKMAMDMVLSIKQDNAKKQKHSTEDPNSQENGNKTKRAGFESRGARR